MGMVSRREAVVGTVDAGDAGARAAARAERNPGSVLDPSGVGTSAHSSRVPDGVHLSSVREPPLIVSGRVVDPSGALDENELFYMKSRGLSERTARLMITEGFAEEILGGVGDKELKGRLQRFVRENTEKILAGEGQC